MREPDTLDYLFVAAITVLAYLHLPWRPEIRGFLQEASDRGLALVDAGIFESGLFLAVLVLAVAVFIVFVTKVLPRFSQAE